MVADATKKTIMLKTYHSPTPWHTKLSYLRERAPAGGYMTGLLVEIRITALHYYSSCP